MTDDVVERGTRAIAIERDCPEDFCPESICICKTYFQAALATLKPGDVFGDHYVETVHEGMIFARQAAEEMREGCAKLADAQAAHAEICEHGNLLGARQSRQTAQLIAEDIRALPLPGEKE